ncbi:MAG: TY-Chap domain-containing protein [Candidatus Heimdallarchaeota archaeon]
MTKFIVSEIELVDKFKELMQASEDGFLIVAPQNYSDVYVQFTYSSAILYCEAVSNEYLPKKKQLTKTKIGLLKQWNFTFDKNESPNFTTTFSTSNLPDLVNQIIKIFNDVYGVFNTNQFEIELVL